MCDELDYLKYILFEKVMDGEELDPFDGGQGDGMDDEDDDLA